MSIETYTGFPPQSLSYRQKGPKWGKQCVDFADAKGSRFHSTKVEETYLHKRINVDLVNMKLHVEDIQYVLNPNRLKANFIPENLQHYPIINSKLNVLRGEAIARPFDWHAVVTNPSALSDIENQKRDIILQNLQSLIEDQSTSEEEFMAKLQEQEDYFQFQYQDMRVQRATELLKHYQKEYDFKDMFDTYGIMDAMAVKEEAYLCDIVGGEPILERLDPLKLRVYRNGNSNRIEDADMIVYEDFWPIGRIRDTYHDVLTKKDLDYLNKLQIGVIDDNDVNWDERRRYIDDFEFGDALVRNPHFFSAWAGGSWYSTSMPFDSEGNVRVLRVYWKSNRKIKKVKSYDPITGEEVFHFYPETYVIDKTRGEEEEIYWVNEAWEGTKIGTEIYVNVRPRPIQYNSMSNPSRCHFGIIGQIYNIGYSNSPSLVDILKPYSYLYDAVFDKTYKLIESNLGKLTVFDTASIPDTWDVQKWLYFAKINHIAVKNSFNEGKKGATLGKVYGAMNTNSTGVIDASVGNEIQYNIQLLEWITREMSDACGISPQREGQISNRETVGGVERATLQSAHITEWLFAQHDNLKKRVYECFIETAKIALKGRKKKFEYITSNGSRQLMEIDGDQFAECDYGIVVDNSPGTLALAQKLESLAQAGLQNQMFNFSTMMKLFGSESIPEKIKIMENAERKAQEMQQQQAQQQMQLQQQQMQQQAQMEQAKLDREYQMHQEDNETKILVAQINASAEDKRFAMMNNDNEVEKEFTQKEFDEKIRQFDEQMKQNKAKLDLEKQKHRDDVRLKEKQIKKAAARQ